MRTVNISFIFDISEARIGNFIEVQTLESLGIDCIDESEVLMLDDELLYK